MTIEPRSHGGGIENRVSSLEIDKRKGRLNRYTVATVPPASDHLGCIAYVSNGAAGSPVIAFSNGTNWLRCDTLAVIS